MKDILSIFSYILIAYLIIQNHKKLIRMYKKLTSQQFFKVLTLYTSAIMIATILIYFAGNWFVQFIEIKGLRFIAKIAIILGTFYIVLPPLQKRVHRVTDGIISFKD